jgi:hypothetical protein
MEQAHATPFIWIKNTVRDLQECGFAGITFEKNKQMHIRVKILPKNVFESTKTNEFCQYSLLIKDGAFII